MVKPSLLLESLSVGRGRRNTAMARSHSEEQHMTAISRRTFVGGSLAAVAALRYGRAFAAGEPDIVDVSGSDPQKMIAAVFAALGGIGKFVKKGDFVIIKPNAAFANPAEWGSTTHPQTVLAVAKACLEAKAKGVMILEFPQAKGEMCLKRCGLTEAMAALPAAKIKLLASASDFQKTEVKGGVSLKTTDVAKNLLSADVFISLPAAKAHYQSGVSLGLKNNMGLVYDGRSFTPPWICTRRSPISAWSSSRTSLSSTAPAPCSPTARQDRAIRQRLGAWWPAVASPRSMPTG